MKVIFLDIDGVLNNDEDLFNDTCLNNKLIENLKLIVDTTKAKIVLSSTWRVVPNSVRRLMDKLAEFDLYLYSMTQEGIAFSWLKQTQWAEVKPCERYYIDDDICYDRGAEIAYWLSTTKQKIDKFIIIDDDLIDIKQYFPMSVMVKTSFKTGLTLEQAAEAIIKLGD